MESSIRGSLTRNETGPTTIPAAAESTPQLAVEVPPTADLPAGTNSAGSTLEVLTFLSEFFLAMQIPAPEFTEDQERVYRHSQAVLLHTLNEAHRVLRYLDGYARDCVLLRQAVERRPAEVEMRESQAAQTALDRFRDNAAFVAEIRNAATRIQGERLGARIRRAGRTIRSVFRRSRREAEGDSDDAGGESGKHLLR
ncbi:hypothetical protein MMC34_000365 [Xylographa carneopallida]|nr:hypothetical protein [Xylographa carneopallida]